MNAALRQISPQVAAKPDPMRVFIVDDDPIHRETSRMFLTMYGRKVTLAENGGTCLRIAAETDFDVLVVDLDMPDMTGLEVIAAIRAMPRHRDLPIIMVTSRDDAMAIDRAFELGASSFVVKPVNWTLLDHYLRFVLRASKNEIAARAAFEGAEAVSRAKDNLLAVIRHEMKTPLNAILGFTKLAVEAQASGDVSALRERLEFVRESGERLLASFGDMAIYSDLLSHSFTITPERIPVSWLIGDVLDMRSRQAVSQEISLVSHDEFRAAHVRADQALLVSALVRLVDNALRHAKDAKTIDLGISVGADETVKLTVSDDGQGMSPEQVAQCLAPFSQADMSRSRANEGLGLGLPIALEIAQLHGGSLTMTSEPGQGTQVTITLPKA
jgi:two-component system, sensor histidine kinase and response regulator